MAQRGFTLLEALIAVAVMCVASLGIAQLLAVALEAVSEARAQTITASLAASRMEQLRSLVFAFDDAGQRITDTTANVSTEPVGRDGSGLSNAGTDSVAASTAGFVDYLDAAGAWVGSSGTVPRNAVFVRRWAIDSAAEWPDRLVLQVQVRTIAADRSGDSSVRRGRGEARFTTVMVRTHR